MHAAAAACDDAVVPWLHLISPVRASILFCFNSHLVARVNYAY